MWGAVRVIYDLPLPLISLYFSFCFFFTCVDFICCWVLINVIWFIYLIDWLIPNEDLWGPHLLWSNLWANNLVKEKPQTSLLSSVAASLISIRVKQHWAWRLLTWCMVYINKLCGRPPQYVPAPCKLRPFDLESGVRVTCDVGYLCVNFSLPRLLCSRLRSVYTTVRCQTRIIA